MELNEGQFSDLDVDGYPSGHSGIDFASVHPNVGATGWLLENESKRKRDCLEEGSNVSETDSRLSVCSDSCTVHQSYSSSGSSESSDGSIGLESEIIELDLDDRVNSDQSENGRHSDDGLFNGLVVGRETEKENSENEYLDDRENKESTFVLSNIETNDNCSDEDDVAESDDELWRQDEDGDMILNIAIICMQCRLATTLITVAEQHNLNLMNMRCQTPLHLAALTGQTEVTSQLLSAHACVHLRDNKGRTALHIACEKQDLNLLVTILDKEWTCFYMDARLKISYPTPLCSSAKSDLLNITDANGQACLHIAVQQGNLDIVKLLLSKGADVNIPDRKSGRTPLHLAVESKNQVLVDFLLQQDEIRVNKKTYADETAMVIAYHRNFSDIVDSLTEKGAKMNFKYLAKFGFVRAETKKRFKVAEQANG